jgi:hypothetical protein
MDQMLMLTVSPSANSTRGPSCHRLSAYVQLSRSGGRATIMRRCRQATCARQAKNKLPHVGDFIVFWSCLSRSALDGWCRCFGSHTSSLQQMISGSISIVRRHAV